MIKFEYIWYLPNIPWTTNINELDIPNIDEKICDNLYFFIHLASSLHSKFTNENDKVRVPILHIYRELLYICCEHQRKFVKFDSFLPIKATV